MLMMGAAASRVLSFPTFFPGGESSMSMTGVGASRVVLFPRPELGRAAAATGAAAAFRVVLRVDFLGASCSATRLEMRFDCREAGMR